MKERDPNPVLITETKFIQESKEFGNYMLFFTTGNIQNPSKF